MSFDAAAHCRLQNVPGNLPDDRKPRPAPGMGRFSIVAQLRELIVVHGRIMKPDPAVPPLLMVDDDDNDAVIFTRRLKAAGVRIPLIHIRNGGDAFVFLNQFCAGRKPIEERPALIFLDVNMPSLSGFDILLWAKQQPALKSMKIIMLSGATEPWDAQIAAKLGADDYVMKFPDAEALSHLLAEHLAPERVATAGPEPTPT